MKKPEPNSLVILFGSCLLVCSCLAFEGDHLFHVGLREAQSLF